MKRESVWGMIIVLAVIILAVRVNAQSLSPNNYFHALVHYSEADCATPAQETTIAYRYSFILDGGCSKDMNSIKGLNPNTIWAFYNSGTDNDVPGAEHSYVINTAKARGIDPEDNYLHYYRDTQVSLGGQTLNIPGWGGGSAAAESLARVPLYWNGRVAVNFGSPNGRQLHKEYMVSQFKTKDPSTNYYFDCIFLDNSSDGVLYNFGGIISGGEIAEHPTHAQIGSTEFNAWHGTNLKLFFAALRDTLRLGPQWSPDGKVKYLSANGSLNSAGLIDWAVDEYNLSPIRNWLTWIEAAIQINKNNWLQKTKIFYESRITTEVNGRSGKISYAQGILDNLATHYLVRTDSSNMFMSGPYQVYIPGWDTLVWRGCMDYDIGDALGDYNPNFFSGVDGKGYTFRVLSRQYQGALVLVRPRGDYNQDFDDATIVNVPLGGSYRPLNPNGTLGASTTSIPMRNGQGAILIPSTGGNTPPGTPSLVSPPDGDTVTGSKPILTVSNAFDPDVSDNITYFFEVYSNPTLTALVASSPAVNEGTSTTSWTLSTDLQDSSTYWWRCRAYDGQAYSSWMAAKSFSVFSIGTGVNNPPSVPVAYLPGNRDTVNTSRPVLTVYNSTDPDQGEVLVYEFQVFADSLLTNLVTSQGSVNQGNTYTSWTVNLDLQDSAIYWWRCRAYDGEAYSTWMPARSFLVLSGPLTAFTYNPHAFPNPFKPSEGATVITFADLPPGSNLKIATVSGELVYQVKLSASDTQFVWEVKNQDGKELASGVYLYTVSYTGGSTTGKLAVIK